MSKGKWSRDNAPRPKFIITSVTLQEYDLCHTIARSMGLTISALMRRLIQDQYYRLASNSYVPSPEQSLNLSEVEP